MRDARGDMLEASGVSARDVSPSKRRPELLPRDLGILEDLEEYRYLSTAQIARLRFGNLKLAQRRMRRLISLGKVIRVPRTGLARVGFRDSFFALAPSVALPADAASAETKPGPLAAPTRGFGIRYAEHHRLLTDVRIWLREAASATRGSVLCRFLPAYAEIRRDGRRVRVAAVDLGPPEGLLVPDGVFELRTSQVRAALFFLEVDRGTEPLSGKHPSSILNKLTAYRRLYDGRFFDRYCELFEHEYSGFRVLFVAPDDDRATRILEVAAKADLSPLVWAVPEAALRETGSLRAPVWRDAQDSPYRSLLE